MAIQLRSTKDLARANGIKMTCYAVAGAGKTTLSSTFGDIPVVVLSAEAGLLSLRKFDIAAIEIKTIADIYEAYNFLTTNEEGKKFKAIVIDSISEIGEVILNAEKAATKDGRAAYGNTNEKLMELLRAFRDLPSRHVLFIAKLEKQKDEMTGAMMFGPSMPGAKLSQAIPYLTDEVFALRVEKDSEGNLIRVLQTQPDYQWTAKDRSGALSQWEQPNMKGVIEKIISGE